MSKHINTIINNRTVINKIDIFSLKDLKVIEEKYYCIKVNNMPFGKGLLKDVKPRKNVVYAFAKGYAFYLHSDFGLVKILNFPSGINYAFVIKEVKDFSFTEKDLILVNLKKDI